MSKADLIKQLKAVIKHIQNSEAVYVLRTSDLPSSAGFFYDKRQEINEYYHKRAHLIKRIRAVA